MNKKKLLMISLWNLPPQDSIWNYMQSISQQLNFDAYKPLYRQVPYLLFLSCITIKRKILLHIFLLHGTLKIVKRNIIDHHFRQRNYTDQNFKFFEIYSNIYVAYNYIHYIVMLHFFV